MSHQQLCVHDGGAPDKATIASSSRWSSSSSEARRWGLENVVARQGANEKVGPLGRPCSWPLGSQYLRTLQALSLELRRLEVVAARTPELEVNHEWKLQPLVDNGRRSLGELADALETIK